jgi:CheY-like chemotaxis protein
MKKILLVDDEPDIRRIAEIALRAQGPVEIINASSGAEALALARQHRPDVVLLDVMMPGLDGLTALGELKRDPATRAIPGLVMTARASRAEQARYVDLGAADVVVKPFDPTTLIGRIEAVLSTHALAEMETRLDAELAALRREFVERLPAQLARLDGLVAKLLGAMRPAAAEALVSELAAEAHRLRGTAGSHGFTAFAAAIERLEAALGDGRGSLDVPALEASLTAARAALPEVSSRR